MDLRAGFQLDDPAVFVPWTATCAELRRMLEPHGLRTVADGYLSLSCASLGGLRHELAFRFGTAPPDRLNELEIILRPHPGLAESYRLIQAHLEATFGPPTRTTPDGDGLDSHEWRLPGARVEHVVSGYDGRRETTTIRRID